ncbi:MAG: RNA polymerase sigma-54 factor [Rhodopirellula sp. TMED11]|nr:MAG: RNA polymerase sigma-54 factor [Rhodopirellula sp. TMED11]
MRMSMGLRPELKQTQTLAPRMIQSMEILQLPMLALQERIEQELTENPLLEQTEVEPIVADDDSDQRSPNDNRSEDERELVVNDNSDNKDDFERLENITPELPNTFDEPFRRSSNQMQDDADRRHDLMANAQSRPESLNDYLLHQLAELDIDDDAERIAERIISTLDARTGGYLQTPLADLLTSDHSAADYEVAERALQIVQSLEPTGIAARSLSECLLMQLRPEFEHYEEMEVLISRHLEDLAANRLPQIQKATGYSIELIQTVRDELQVLNPKPGSQFLETHVPSVTPDIILEQDEEGNYQIRLDDDRVPSLNVSDYYRRRLQDPSCSPEEREFIKRKVNSAQWLIEAIQQRRSTLTRVAEAIVAHQKRFFDEGPESIEPLKMQQIAEKVGVHVTTVSRAVNDKWMQTPRGIIPLDRLFVGGTQTDDGEDVAWVTIRLKLQELIDNEDKGEPLSDDSLVKKLAEQGMTVARRTVTKYRKRMGIPSSRQRKDWSLTKK